MQGALGAQHSAAGQPQPAQQQQQHTGVGISRSAPSAAGVSATGASAGVEEPSGVHPEEHSDDGDWETASEESADYDAQAAAESGSAAAKNKEKDGDTSKKQHSRKAEENQRPDIMEPAGNEVSLHLSYCRRGHDHTARRAYCL